MVLHSSTTPTFKEEHPFEERKKEAGRIRVKYPGRIPVSLPQLSKTIIFNRLSKSLRSYVPKVICERTSRNDIAQVDKRKFLVPSDLSMGQFVFVIRKRIAMSPENGLYLFVNGDTMVQTSALLSEVYEANRDEDGFLYVNYGGENTFGSS
ncbi:unnamed protein product [Discosporangium mesarthrocarpum]